MTKLQRYAFRLELALSILSGALAILTAIWRDWIERIFHADPDAGSGGLEWAIVFALALVAIAVAAHARKSYVRWAGAPAAMAHGPDRD